MFVFLLYQRLNLTFSSRINPVETLYAAFPALMYIDPSLGRPLLEPLFRLQAQPNYSVPFAASDLGASPRYTKCHTFRGHVGSNYPNITGGKSVHDQGVERPLMIFTLFLSTSELCLVQSPEIC